MRVMMIVDEDFTNYKEASMFIGAISCSGKCYKELGLPSSICQNDSWRSPGAYPVDMPDYEIVGRYMCNDITSAIVFGGLEPFEQKEEMIHLIKKFREFTSDDIVIYTGYNECELESEIKELKRFKNIIIKFGRFVPGTARHMDDVLGVEILGDQYARKIS